MNSSEALAASGCPSFDTADEDRHPPHRYEDDLANDLDVRGLAAAFEAHIRRHGIPAAGVHAALLDWLDELCTELRAEAT
ncbi:hypothetical protein [Jiangella muralis]|uniref:hypothetical protein n=1 Tax=Jiangella muralis TaxID=702383 RepID=UPI001F0B385B|nr:hypothetical protein [Jiangella muralis]